METPQQSKQPKGIRIVWVLVLMFASFAAGIYIGLNPKLVPWTYLPLQGGGVDTGNVESSPSTQPTTEPLAGPPATQPASQGQ